MARLRRKSTILVIGASAVLYWAAGEPAAKWVTDSGAAFGLGHVLESTDDWLARTGIRGTLSDFTESADYWLAHASAHFGFGGATAEQFGYRFAEVTRGDVLSAVVATGTLAPVGTVLVGTQVSGQVNEVRADFNSEVRLGDVIAIIDPVSFELAVEQAAADLEVAEAAVLTAEAELQRAQAEFENATANLASAQAEAERILFQVKDFQKDAERKTALAAKGNIAGAEKDRAEAALDMARAQYDSLLAQAEGREAARRAAAAAVKAAETRIANAKAVAQQKRAAFRQAQTDLDRTIIRAPVDGVVIYRDIDAGQTVAASLQAPTLFTIAQDLKQMRVEASVDESEIGQIAPGQAVVFTVDAYPDRRFSGTVSQIRLSPKTAQNVVTYTVIVTADNADQLLMPGMTATARFQVAERRNVLTVPTAALRVRLPGAPAAAGQSRVWVDDRGGLRQVPVNVGLTDGTRTEVSGEGLEEGLHVVTGVEMQKPTRSAAQRLIGGT